MNANRARGSRLAYSPISPAAVLLPTAGLPVAMFLMNVTTAFGEVLLHVSEQVSGSAHTGTVVIMNVKVTEWEGGNEEKIKHSMTPNRENAGQKHNTNK